MRKTLAICLFLVLCCVSGVGQTQAQWAVVWSVALFNQSSPINRTVAFTPTEDGVYRLSCAMSGRGSNNNYNFQMYWALPDGGIGEYALIPGANVMLVFMPKASVPVIYYVVGSQGTGTYNLGCTVEQLQNSN